MTGPDRRRLLGMLAVLVVIAAAVAVVVATAREDPPARLRATGSLDAQDGAPSTIALPDLTTFEATTSTEPPPTTTTRPAVATVAVRTLTPPPPAPATTTTTVPPPTLDVGPEACGEGIPPQRITGAVIGVAAPDGLHEVSLDGTRDVRIPNTPSTPMLQAPAWSADGRRLAFVQPSPTRQDTNHYPSRDLVVVDLERGCSRVLSPRGQDSLDQPAWSPDGAMLSYVRSVGGNWSVPRMLETVRDDGTGVTRLAQGAIIGGSWAPDGSGRLAYGQDGGLRVRSRDGKVIVVDDTTGGAECESWSPDATKLVYTVSVHQGIWVAAADGSGYRDLSPKGTRMPNGIFWSRFSPDGRRIAFGWTNEVWVIDAEGNNAQRIAEKTGHNGARWTPSGDELVYDGEGGVRVISVEGGESRLLRTGLVAAVFHRS